MTSPKLPPIAEQYTGHVYQVTTIPQCYWRKLLWRHTRLYRLYIRFGIILTQFCINFSRQEHQIDVLYVSFKTWDSKVSAYTPFHFSFTVPLILNFLANLSKAPEHFVKYTETQLYFYVNKSLIESLIKGHGSVYTAQLMCLMFIRPFKVIKS